ncbi:MAG TPA: amino acid adenylation domain-containing protein [Thermoanaerobaculia bacterium]|nr:amino acid adenylation domain-containing protein [Thermoanaerobaculia bacterium]
MSEVGGAGGSIGRPIRNTGLAILDRAGEPAAVGVAGELWIGGLGVARGYLGRPDLTAERFVPDQYAHGAGGARAYRTGDLARWRADGTVEFLGRIDAQVKVRGYRIELGEVEAALEALPGVAQGVAAVRGEGEAKILVGYFVPSAAAAEGAVALRARLARTLPDSMIPTSFVGLDAFPLTPNGKVDRRALPAPQAATADFDSSAPRSAVEEVIAAIFAETLGRERVGALDSFFDLGGHSLLATRAMVRIAEAFGVEVPLVRMFEWPTAAGLAEVVAELRGAGLGVTIPPLVPGSAGERPPLSFAQQRIWLLDRLGLAGAGYNLPVATRLSGPLSAGLLRAAIAALADRHEVLRTSFPSALGEAWQEVAPHLKQPLVEADLIGLPERVRATESRRLLSLVARAPFDLSRGPLCRALAVRLGTEEQALLLVLHHTVADGWSMNLALSDLAEIARALSAGEAPRLAPLPIRYADFAVWQREALDGELLQALLAHWRERLARLPTALALPVDRQRRSAARHLPAGAARVALGAASTAALRDLARRQGATPFMALFAGFAALLARVTGQGDFALGTPIAGRSRRDLEPMIGFFANTLVLRAELGREPSFTELLGRARSTALDAYDHQDLPFERLVEELRPERDLAVHPLFQVMFQMQVMGAMPRGPVTGALSMAPIEVGRGPARFDLILSLGETASNVSGLFEYDPELFDPPTVLRLAERFSALIAEAVAAPGRSIYDLPLLSAAERQQTSVEWNATATDIASAPAPFRPLADPIVEQAKLRPDAVALSCGQVHLSYGALDRRSAGLAARLRGLAADGAADRPLGEPLVAVALERSIELPVALVAAVRAGAAYVPIDPEYPAERQAWMLEDARPIAVVTTRALAATLPLGGATPVWAEEMTEVTFEAPSAEPASGPESLAYTIFTSGSTGRPKGAMNSHRAIVNRLDWMQEAYGLTSADVVAQKTPASFDVSVWELFWPLRLGARMALAPPGLHRDATGLARWIAEEDVTTIHFVPSMLRAFLDETGVETRVGSLRRVIASGEALSPDLARRFHERLGGSARRQATELHNLYGPTEAAVDVTFHPCRPGEASVPIGRPIAHLAIHLVDAHGLSVPAGSPGELLIGGVGLGRGYLHRPDLTPERFVPDMFGDVPGARLYRTGDLARHRADGAIEYLGRIDHQVKIRGVRIELGEIESALDALPEVAQAVVLLERAESRLIAYLVAAGSPETARPEAPALRAALARRLPEALVPAVFVWLDELPLSPSGKVDRRALPDVAAGAGRRAGAGVEYVPPSSALEELIAAIYCELLGVDRLGVKESFFDVGGHSLLATRAAARLSEALAIEVPLARLFERPSIGALAAALVAESAEPGELEHSAALALDLAQMSDEEVAALLVEYERRAPVAADAEEPARSGEAA